MTAPPRKPTVPEVLPLVWAYRDREDALNDVGGSLHIVLSDRNVETHHVRFCLEYARERGDEEGERLATLLLQMSETQRLKIASRFYEGA